MPNVPNRSVLEGEFARRMARLSTKHRRELESLLGRPPDVENIPPGFWTRVEEENKELLNSILILIFIATATRRESGLSENRSEALAQVFARRRAAETAARIVNRTRFNVQRFGNLLRDRRANGLPVSQTSVLLQTATIFSPGRSAVIATTETTNAATEASRGAKTERELETGIKLKLVWKLGPCQHCSFCPLVADTSEEFWGRFIGGPPGHVNCCCHLVYVPEDERTKPPPDPGRVLSAARASGIFGFS